MLCRLLYDGNCSCIFGEFVNDCTIFFVNESINNHHYFMGHYFALQIIIATRLQWSNFNRSKTLATTQLEALKQVFLSGLTFNMYSSQKVL
jgi:hypothetical protein